MATVTPGKQFVDDELVTTAKLNQLGSPIVELDQDDTDTMIAAVRQAIPTVNRNALINGNFNVWQRGGHLNIAGLPEVLGDGAGPAMGADRWYLGEPSGANKREITQGSFTPGQTDVPNEPQYFLGWNQLVAETGANRPVLSQWIEDVRTFAGKSVVLTWWMKGNYTGGVEVGLAQFSGGSPGSTELIEAITGGTPALVSGSAWQKFTATFDLPLLTGVSTGADSYLAVNFSLPDNVTFQIDFAQVQLEEGTVATPFEVQPYMAVLGKCERYFEYHEGVAGTDVSAQPPCYYFATKKYRSPTLTLLAGYAGTMTAANFSTMLGTGYYLDTANSVVSVFFMACEAEISMP